MKAAWIALAMLVVAWVPPIAEGKKDVYRWRDASGVVHFADRPGQDRAPRPGQDASGRQPAGEPIDCAHIRQQLVRAAEAGRRLRVRALEEQWSDACR